jgi:thiamine biosynthesis protein ThiI
VNALTKVFGIVGICPIVVEEDTSFEAIKEKVIAYVDQAYRKKNFTFKVNTRRNDKSYPMTSMEVNAELGHYLLEAFPDTSVDVHEPDEIINVEDGIYLFDHDSRPGRTSGWYKWQGNGIIIRWN